jgi:glutathione S-transferase
VDAALGASLKTAAMWQLYQFPLCPFSRKVRLLLAEKGVEHELVRESPWLKRDEFTDLNPAGQTPVLVEESRGIVLIDSRAICEYFEETVDRSPMIAGTAPNRAEVRRLVAWFDEGLYREVVAPMMEERMTKRLVSRDAPDTRVLREAMRTANAHLDYVDYLLDHRRWLAGPVLSLADLACAAHLSVADYLGGIDWRGHKQTSDWYSVMKSRPSFRPLLTERMEVIAPPAHYDKVDF